MAKFNIVSRPKVDNTNWDDLKNKVMKKEIDGEAIAFYVILSGIIVMGILFLAYLFILILHS